MMRRTLHIGARLWAVGSAALLACAAAAVAQEAGGAEALEVYARGDYAAVVKLLEPAYRTGKAKIQERLLLARACLHLKRTDQSLAVLRSVLDSDRENPEANSLTGQILHRATKHKEAVAYLEHAIRLKPDDAVAAAALGHCYHALGLNAKAKVHLEKAIELDIRNPANSFLLGKICLARGLGALAEKHLLKAQDAGLDSRELHLLLGKAYLLQRKLLGPILARRITSSPKTGEIVNDYVVLGKIPGAAHQYRVCTRFSALYQGYRLLRFRRNDPDALHFAAAGWLAAGQLDLARSHLLRLQQLEPRSRRTTELLANTQLAARQLDALEQTVQAAHKAKLFDARTAGDFLYRAALGLRAEGKRAEAIRLLRQAERHTPTAAKVLRSLAGLHVVMGRAREASRAYGRLIELFPDAPDVDEWRHARNVLDGKTGAQK